jgi:hypothetical protein
MYTGTAAHPAFCTVGTGSFLGINWLVNGIDHLLSAEVKESKATPLLPFWDFVVCYWANVLPFADWSRRI